MLNRYKAAQEQIEKEKASQTLPPPLPEAETGTHPPIEEEKETPRKKKLPFWKRFFKRLLINLVRFIVVMLFLYFANSFLHFWN